MNIQISKGLGVISITAIACMLISPLGLPKVSEALNNPCHVYYRTILLSAAIVLVSSLLSFAFLKTHKVNLTSSIVTIALHVAFLSLFTYATLFIDDCISCFAFLTSSCERSHAL